MPGALLVPYSVVPPDVRIDAWWRWPGTFGLVASEWTKYVFARARIALASVVADTAGTTSGTE